MKLQSLFPVTYDSAFTSLFQHWLDAEICQLSSANIFFWFIKPTGTWIECKCCKSLLKLTSPTINITKYLLLPDSLEYWCLWTKCRSDFQWNSAIPDLKWVAFEIPSSFKSAILTIHNYILSHINARLSQHSIEINKINYGRISQTTRREDMATKIFLVNTLFTLHFHN